MLRLNRIVTRKGSSIFNIKPASETAHFKDNSSVEVAVNLSDLKANEADFAKNYLHKFLSSDGQCLLTFSDKSRYQLENTRLAVKRAKHLVDTIEKLTPEAGKSGVEDKVFEATREWWPFIDMSGLPKKFQNNRTLLYGTDRARAQVTERGDKLDAAGSYKNIDRVSSDDGAAREYGRGVLKPYEINQGRGYQKNFRSLRNRSFHDERSTAEVNADAVQLIKSREKSRFIRNPILDPTIHAVEEVTETKPQLPDIPTSKSKSA